MSDDQKRPLHNGIDLETWRYVWEKTPDVEAFHNEDINRVLPAFYIALDGQAADIASLRERAEAAESHLALAEGRIQGAMKRADDAEAWKQLADSPMQRIEAENARLRGVLTEFAGSDPDSDRFDGWHTYDIVQWLNRKARQALEEK